MADKLFSALGVRAAVLTTDIMALLPNAGPPAEQATVAKLITLLDTLYAPITGGNYVLKSGDTMTGKLIITQATANTSILTSTGYSLTGANAQNMLDFAGTWNTSGNPTALRIAITNTASGATSKFLEFLAGAGGATSIFSVAKDGAIDGQALADMFSLTTTNMAGVARVSGGILGIGGVGGCFGLFEFSGQLKAVFGSGVSWGFASIANGTPTNLRAGMDTIMVRDAANTFAQRNSTTAQMFRLYRTWTDASNYERLALQTAAGQVIVAAETAGTGGDDIEVALTSAGASSVNVTRGLLRYGTGFTVATLPAAGVAGRMAYVTDGLGAAWGVAIAGGGAQTVPVFDNGAAWIAA